MYRLLRQWAVVWAMGGALLFAQSPTGVIHGEVVDPAGNAMPGATVSVVDAKTGFSFKQQTGQDGTAAFTLPVGVYQVKAEQEGFATATRSSVTLDVDQSLRLRFALPVAERKDVVVVYEQAGEVSTNSSSLGSVVSRREVRTCH